MNRFDLTKNNFFDKSLVEGNLDDKVIQMWSRHNHGTIPFYATGFETISFNQDKSFVLETVLASSVAMDNEVLIVGFGNSMEKLQETVSAQNLTYHCLDLSYNDCDDLNSKILRLPYISHLLIGIDSKTDINNIPVDMLLNIASKRRYSLIAYCDTIVDGLNDIFNGAIDFMIGGLSNLRSFVVARRSKLVQTEGNSKYFSRDLYSYWQWTMRDRKPIIKPMSL